MTTTGTTPLNLERDELHRGWICYDAECQLCRNAARRFERLLNRHQFQLVPLQTGWLQDQLGLKPGERLNEMKLIENDGKIYGGADALVQIARQIWWLWPIFALANIPGLMVLLRANYRWVATNRHCLNGVCSKKTTTRHRHTAFFEI